MLFAISMIDRPHSEELREVTTNAHQAYVMAATDGMYLGGPLLADDGKTMVGSLIIKEFADRAEAQAFIEAEPYNAAGLFESVTIRRFGPVVLPAGASRP